MTHDYKRHGTTDLFTARNVLDDIVFGTCSPRHRHEEFPKFLRPIDQDTPHGAVLHLMILDNYGTHSHPRGICGLRSIHDTTCTLPRRVPSG
jgi:hypothetical protein